MRGRRKPCWWRRKERGDVACVRDFEKLGRSYESGTPPSSPRLSCVSVCKGLVVRRREWVSKEGEGPEAFSLMFLLSSSSFSSLLRSCASLLLSLPMPRPKLGGNTQPQESTTPWYDSWCCGESGWLDRWKASTRRGHSGHSNCSPTEKPPVSIFFDFDAHDDDETPAKSEPQTRLSH